VEHRHLVAPADEGSAGPPGAGALAVQEQARAVVRVGGVRQLKRGTQRRDRRLAHDDGPLIGSRDESVERPPDLRPGVHVDVDAIPELPQERVQAVNRELQCRCRRIDIPRPHGELADRRRGVRSPS